MQCEEGGLVENLDSTPITVYGTADTQTRYIIAA